MASADTGLAQHPSVLPQGAARRQRFYLSQATVVRDQQGGGSSKRCWCGEEHAPHPARLALVEDREHELERLRVAEEPDP